MRCSLVDRCDESPEYELGGPKLKSILCSMKQVSSQVRGEVQVGPCGIVEVWYSSESIENGLGQLTSLKKKSQEKKQFQSQYKFYATSLPLLTIHVPSTSAALTRCNATTYDREKHQLKSHSNL